MMDLSPALYTQRHAIGMDDQNGSRQQKKNWQRWLQYRREDKDWEEGRLNPKSLAGSEMDFRPLQRPRD